MPIAIVRIMEPENNYFISANNHNLEKFNDLNYQRQNQKEPQQGILNASKKPFLAKVIKTKIASNQQSDSECQNAADDGVLFVECNDVVTIEDLYDDKWFYARSDHIQGKLSIDSCQILDDYIPLYLCQYLVDNQYFELHVCFASFVAQDVGDLSVTKGDIMIASNQVNEHWMQGQVCFDSQSNSWPRLVVSQQVGTFPLNHCWRLDPERVKSFCHDKLSKQRELYQQQQQQHQQPPPKAIPPRPAFIMTTHSSSLSSGSSSLHSADYQSCKQQQLQNPGPNQLPQHTVQQAAEKSQISSLLNLRQQDKLKGWLHTVKKKTARLSTRITASLGLISLTRDEEFERHYENFKNIEKTIRAFIKNLTAFVEHFENFLLALQNTSENLSDFYRDKSHKKEFDELRKKNKALTCEHFHAFKRTVERQVISVASQLLQKFANPHQLINKRSAKLLDYDNKTKEMESCRDLEKKAALRDQYVIAKDLYDRINKQLIEELPMFNRIALDIFRECILVLLESRRNLVLSYTKQTASLLGTPLMATFTASDVASSILMSCDLAKNFEAKQNADIDELLEQDRKDSGQTSGGDTRLNSANGDGTSRPHSATSQLSSDFDHMAVVAREISSTPLSHMSEKHTGAVKFDEPDGVHNTSIEEDNRVPSGAGETENSDCEARKEPPKERRKKKKFQIYVASWPFVATGPNQLTIACKQPLKLIKGCDECGNSDWSLVQDKKGHLGYVPSSYIKKKE